ncbi:MAG: alpha-1,2-fucosyltransferase [Roseinatronobacter sp.]|nr:alpha-1,2-fucosyltransferase [Roseinatronobacter sp.]
MVITKLIGGLGNQMFQYAAGVSLARNIGVDLRIDKNALRTYNLHQGYQLDEIFQGDFIQATEWEMFKLMGLRKFKIVKRGAEVNPKHKFKAGYPFIRQPTHNYWADFDKITTSGYLAGYWQSSKYFANSEAEVRQAFSFKDNLTGRNLEIVNKVRSENSVAIHIRRGDYISDPGSLKFHGFCDWNYYDKAVSIIIEKTGASKFYIFSDEPEVARLHFQDTRSFEIVDWNTGRSSYRDMQIMSHCRHHIIANSTFSWWGAWLADSPEQVVVAPSSWFQGSDEQIVDIYEPDWIII